MRTGPPTTRVSSSNNATRYREQQGPKRHAIQSLAINHADLLHCHIRQLLPRNSCPSASSCAYPPAARSTKESEVASVNGQTWDQTLRHWARLIALGRCGPLVGHERETHVVRSRTRQTVCCWGHSRYEDVSEDAQETWRLDQKEKI